MTPPEIKRILPNASKETIRLNSDTRLQDTEPKRPVFAGILEKSARKGKSTGRIVLSYRSCRQRLLDPDNLAGGTKFLTDALRYCGALQGDQEDQITLEFSQTKVEKKAQEKTLITIEYP